MAALTPPVFHPEALICLSDTVLLPVSNGWHNEIFRAQEAGDTNRAAFCRAITDCMHETWALLHYGTPGLVLDGPWGNPIDVRLPHPDDQLYPLP